MKLLLGDCIEKMRELSANLVDTIITDPPYGLGFMGKEWDTFKPEYIDKRMSKDNKRVSTRISRTQRSNAAGSYDFSRNAEFQMAICPFFAEMLRVIKPGGTLLCFGGSRTYHRLACAIEDAGWILKDCIMWLYGSGFPKATDINKQLDKGVEREQEVEETIQEANLFEKAKTIKKKKEKQAGMGTGKSFGMLQSEGTNSSIETPSKVDVTIPTTPEAKLWNGWKSHGLKPAYEPILVAMKPNEGTYAENALKYGVAGLNIDGGRIGTEIIPKQISGKTTLMGGLSGKSEQGGYVSPEHKGRFPANIILDEEASKMLDEQSGESKSTPVGFKSVGWKHSGNMSDKKTELKYQRIFNDKGGASRFFYCAKASKSERQMGMGKEYEIDNTDKYNSKFPCSKADKHKNNHPTVKPLSLMEYLCILTKTPTGGVVLDPFMGSGTTGIACVNTGREFIGIEKEPEYMEIAEKRIEYAVQKRKERLF